MIQREYVGTLLALLMLTPAQLRGQKTGDVNGVAVDEGEAPLTDGVPEGFMLIEGDIIVPIDMPEAGFTTDFWPFGVVPFEFDANVTAANQNAMLTAMAQWEAVADVDFRPKNGSDNDFLHIQNSTGNNSFVGRQGGAQVVNIFNWNFTFVMAHELGHALAFWHEQSRTDRDDFVQINLAIVCQTCCSGGPCDLNFEIENTADNFGPYDFDSVMHYGQCFFSTNANCPVGGGQTITVLPPNDVMWQNAIGQVTHLSFWDMRVMSFLYPEDNWRFVDHTNGGLQTGSFFFPFETFNLGVVNVPARGMLWMLEPGNYSAVGAWTKAVTVDVAQGPITLGS